MSKKLGQAVSRIEFGSCSACSSFGWASNLLPWHLHNFSLQNEQIWKYDLVYSVLTVLVLMT